MTTYSQLVDKMILETKRPDMLSQICDYLNQTIREIHFEPSKGNAVLYRDNYQESLLTADVESGYTWAIPRPQTWQQMNLIRYDSIAVRDEIERYPPEVTPSRALATMTRFFYRLGQSYAFAGYGGLNAVISASWFEFPRRLKYYASASRPATWDDDSGWAYHDDFDDSDELKADARALTSNWLLLRWEDVVSEGLRAKIYKRLSDTERARTSYSMYSTLRQGLYTSEVVQPGNFK